MARIAGVDLPPKKRAEIGLTYIFGIGRTRAKSILYRCGIDFNKKIGDLGEEEVNNIRIILEAEGSVEGDLRKSRSTSSGSSKWAHTADCVTAAVCLCAAREPTRTPAPGRARAAVPWQVRRKLQGRHKPWLKLQPRLLRRRLSKRKRRSPSLSGWYTCRRPSITRLSPSPIPLGT